MADSNADSIEEFHQKLDNELKVLEKFSDAISVTVCGEFKNDVAQHTENLIQQIKVTSDEVKALNNDKFVKSVSDLWRNFDTSVREMTIACREHISPGLSEDEMADAYDRATDNNCYEHPANAQDFDYHQYLHDVQTDLEKSENHGDNSVITDDNYLFRNPDIEKRDKARRKNLQKYDLVKPTVRFLKNCKKLLLRNVDNESSQDNGATTLYGGIDSGNIIEREQQGHFGDINTANVLENEKKALIARLIIKLVRNSELRPYIWNEDYLKLIFGAAGNKLLDLFSYPPLQDNTITNFLEAAETLHNLFQGTVIADFDFKTIRTDLIKDLLVHEFYCCICPLTFDNKRIFKIAQELNYKFGISWDALMNEETEDMKRMCPEHNFSDLFFLGQMSRINFYKLPDKLDETIIDKIDQAAESAFRRMGFPLIFELYSKEYFHFMRGYGFNNTRLMNRELKQFHKLKQSAFFDRNIKIWFKRYMLLSFVDFINDNYMNKTVEMLDNNGIQDLKTETKNNVFDNIMVIIQKTFPIKIEFYLQPRCRNELEKKVGVEYLGQVYVSPVNACVFKVSTGCSFNKDEVTWVLKVLKQGKSYVWDVTEFYDYEKAVDDLRSRNNG